VINQKPEGAGTVGQLGEFALIDAITAVLQPAGTTSPKSVVVGPGDDAAVIALADARAVVSTDAMVEGIHFRRSWSSAADVGTRAAAANLCDAVAMGSQPVALVVALALPSDVPVSWVLDLAAGMKAEADRVGAVVAGGDIVSSPTLMLTVTVVGSVVADRVVLRSGATVGDVVAMTGRLGWAAAGLAVLSRGFSSPRVLADAHRRPEVDYQVALRGAKKASAMCDISDGLVADARHLARASGVRLTLRTADLVVTDAMRDVGAALGVEPSEWVLAGGDDHAFLATFGSARQVPTGWTVIGDVEEGEGVTVDGQNHAGPAGHRHFA